MAFTNTARAPSPKITVEAIIHSVIGNVMNLQADEDAEPIAIDKRAVRVKKRHPGYAELILSENLAIQANLV